jgi:hypothetical protein
MVGEGSQQFDSLRWSATTQFGVKFGKIEGEESAPSRPKSPFFVGSRFHDAKGDGAFNISEEIFDKRLLRNWNKVQKFVCGGGNVFVKYVRKCIG